MSQATTNCHLMRVTSLHGGRVRLSSLQPKSISQSTEQVNAHPSIPFRHDTACAHADPVRSANSATVNVTGFLSETIASMYPSGTGNASGRQCTEGKGRELKLRHQTVEHEKRGGEE